MISSLPGFRRVALTLSAVCAVLCVLTLAVPDWLEAFGIDPDHGNGTVEFLVAVGFAVGTIAFAAGAAVLARRTRTPLPARAD